jgi:Aerotolerance regulator N-terminal
VSIALLLPSALAALAALLLPLIIHLSRRSEQRITDFAALRWLSIKLRPRRKIIFQEKLLLLLRLLLLIALALFLAKPISFHTPAAKHWVLVVPGVDIDAVKKLSIQKPGQWSWLAPGFPEYAEENSASVVPISSLLRELDSQLPENTQLTVIVPEKLNGLDGERIHLSRKIDWKIVPNQKTMDTPAKESSEIANSGMIRLAIRFDPQYADSLVYFRTAYAAWQLDENKKSALDIADTATALKPDHNTLLWLASGELPTPVREWASKGNTVIVAKDTIVAEIKSGVPVWRNRQGHILMQTAAIGQGRVLQWQQTLKPATMPELLEADFPLQLQSHLQATPTPPAQAYATSQTPLKANIAWPKPAQSLQAWLALIILLFFMLERWLANSARRWSAA